MIIHIWMHWFWITILICKGFLLSLSRHVFCSSSLVVEAGLPDASFILNSEDYVLFKDKLFKITSQEDVNIRLRRAVEEEEEEEGVVDEVTTVVLPASNETVSNEATSGEVEVHLGSSDLEDTYNGGTADGFQYPIKKYSKFTKYGKVKSKPKTTEETVVDYEEVIRVNSTAEAVHSNETMTISTSMVENSTVIAVNETENETISEEINSNQTISAAQSTTDKAVEIDFSSEMAVANVTEEETSVEILHTEANLTVENKLDESVIQTTVEPFIFNNRVAAATSSEIRERLSQPLDAGSITGITLGIVVISGFIGAISFVLYRRRYLNKPQALNDKSSNLDSSGYIDDTSLRENSEEMYSLDNDSFLNSLEAMTIQNYWTENVKHTKL